jgi:Uma2 family endonuclease
MLTAVHTLADLLRELGSIAPERVRWRPLPGTATERDVVAIENRENRLFELVDGTLVEKAMGYRESLLALAVSGYLRAFVAAKNLGLVSGADGMVRLFPGLVRIPDVAFVSWERIPGRQVPAEPIPDLAPDLAVEVLSPGNTPAEMSRKRKEYFAAGVRLIWEIDAEARTVTIFQPATIQQTLDSQQTLGGDPVLPGLAISLPELFAELDRKGA